MDPLLAARFTQSAAAVALAGTLGLRLLTWRTDTGGTLRWNGLAWGCWATLVLAAGAVLGLTAAAMTGQSLPDALRGHALVDVLTGTRFGAACQVRAGLLSGVFVVGVLAGRHRARPMVALDALNALLAAAVLVTLVWTSHARSSERSGWLLPADCLHVLAAGVWPGGLLPLAILLARARKDADLARATAAILRRFSWSSTVAVAVLAASGSLDACGLVGTFAALWSSRYGRLLCCKIILFLAMVGFGFVNRRMIRRNDSANAPETVRQLSSNVGWECLLAAGVLLATEALAMSPPPHD